MAASVAEARAAVTAFAQSAGATADALAAVSLAVSEAVTNAVLHAYLDRDTPGTVEVRAHSEDEKVVVVVADEGRGMLPRTDSPGLGLGLPLIAQMTQSLEVHDRQGGGPRSACRSRWTRPPDSSNRPEAFPSAHAFRILLPSAADGRDTGTSGKQSQPSCSSPRTAPTRRAAHVISKRVARGDGPLRG